MNILITGGAGYIGSHFIKQLSNNDNFKVFVIDKQRGYTLDTISIVSKLYKQKHFHFINIDLSQTDKVEELFRNHTFNVIFHFAANIEVNESIRNPLKYYMNNTVNTINLINMAQKYKVDKFIFSSSAAVYGSLFSFPIKETIGTSPITPYGESKLKSERVLIDTAKSNKNFKYIILRYFNVAGASLDNTIGECHIPETHLIPLAIKASIDKASNFIIYGDDYPTRDGSCIRDYVHVEDLASAHIQALNFLNTENTSEIFNCGYGHGFSVKEIVASIKNLSGTDFKVKIAPRRKGDPAVLVSDNSKIKEKMNWNPKYDNLEIICQSALNWEKKKMTMEW